MLADFISRPYLPNNTQKDLGGSGDVEVYAIPLVRIDFVET